MKCKHDHMDIQESCENQKWFVIQSQWKSITKGKVQICLIGYMIEPMTKLHANVNTEHVIKHKQKHNCTLKQKGFILDSILPG